jgi:lipoprotein-anchoring transpeptidase ErfK/SrfK
MWSRWPGGVIAAMLATALCAGIGVTVAHAARSSPSRVIRHPAAPRVDPVPALRAALAAAVTFDPKPGATDVAPDARVVVNTNAGRLTAVRMTMANFPIFGTLSASGKRWQSNGQLATGNEYRITATVSGSAGVTAQSTSTFRTLTPVASVKAMLFPDSLTVGVAQPIVIRFNHFITTAAARAAALDHFTVTESRPVPGGWHWFSNRELHFRPRALWPAGEKVNVASDLNGWNAGNGMWGDGSVHTQFTIGDAHVAIVNLATDQMTVTDNGRLVATYPFSGGRTIYPTMNGVHIVLDRQSVVHMVSSTNGIPVNSPDGYDELVYADVHITDSGEYVHAAPWSVASQGHTNVSHGCINLSPADALTFYAFSRVGDVVAVIGGPRPPAPGDHGVMDWETNWSEWTPAAVHSLFPPPPARTRTPASRTAPRRAG